MTPLELEQLKDKFKAKWPEEPPKFSKKWFEYRGDQSYYRMKRDELKINEKKYGTKRPNEQKEDLSVKKLVDMDPYESAVKLFGE